MIRLSEMEQFYFLLGGFGQDFFRYANFSQLGTYCKNLKEEKNNYAYENDYIYTDLIFQLYVSMLKASFHVRGN